MESILIVEVIRADGYATVSSLGSGLGRGDLLQQAGLTATVEELVQVLTSPSESGTPESAIKELLLPRADCIQVSMDATFALITTRVRGGKVLDIFRNSPYGLTVHRLVR